MLASIRLAPDNKYAIVAALVDRLSPGQEGLARQADFVLYKPISFEQAKRSFRAARYLMKCECRRDTRVEVQFPVSFVSAEGRIEQRAVTLDISDAGVALQLPRKFKKSRSTRLRFTLPGTDHVVECEAELAWENLHSHAGFRFIGLSREAREHLLAWLEPYCFDFHAVVPMSQAQPGLVPATGQSPA